MTLKKIIEKNFPEEYEARKKESDTLAMHEEKEILPFFVMDFLIPTEKVPLNIFEPRYRLMVKQTFIMCVLHSVRCVLLFILGKNIGI